MAEEPECQLRRRRTSANTNLPLNLDVDCQVTEGGPNVGTPSPSPSQRRLTNTKLRSSSSSLLDFKNKQQSFDIQVIQVEECEEEEIIIDSDDDAEENGEPSDRPFTPVPIQDFAANVMYTEGPQISDFLRVNAVEKDCFTDVSDADTEGEEE